MPFVGGSVDAMTKAAVAGLARDLEPRGSDEIAGLVAYLAGPEAAFVTGASLTIDGGFAA